jgi:hypothetical protein
MRSLFLFLALVFESTLSDATSAQAAVLRYAYVGPVFDVATGPLAGKRIEATFDVDCAFVWGNGCRNTGENLMLDYGDYRSPALRRFHASAGELVISDFGGSNGDVGFDTGPDAMPTSFSFLLYGFNNDVGSYAFEVIESQCCGGSATVYFRSVYRRLCLFGGARIVDRDARARAGTAEPPPSPCGTRRRRARVAPSAFL